MKFLLTILILGFAAPVMAQDNIIDTQYYGHLRDTCKRNAAQQLWKRVWGEPAESLTEDTCCMASVAAMEQKGAREAENNMCPDGFQKNILRCMTSKSWCEKVPS